MSLTRDEQKQLGNNILSRIRRVAEFKLNKQMAHAAINVAVTVDPLVEGALVELTFNYWSNMPMPGPVTVRRGSSLWQEAKHRHKWLQKVFGKPHYDTIQVAQPVHINVCPHMSKRAGNPEHALFLERRSAAPAVRA